MIKHLVSIISPNHILFAETHYFTLFSNSHPSLTLLLADFCFFLEYDNFAYFD